MHKCCSLDQTRRSQRRVNGLQLPLNCHQVIGWIVFAITAVLNFFVLVRIQVENVGFIAVIMFAVIYVAHIVSHSAASLLDPSEKELRKSKINIVPEFDRNIHAHVIENGRCHLCNIYTSSKKTKHCSLCNKCVDRFDHHCKWLNSCVGHRNYRAFIASVATALLLSLFTSSLCIIDIVLFIIDPRLLSNTTQEFINCSPDTNVTIIFDNIKFCKTSILFLLFVILFCLCGLGIGCALLHLLCFHIYITLLGVSTYEYIIKSGSERTATSHMRKFNCEKIRFPGKLYVTKTNIKKKPKLQETSIENGRGDTRSDKVQNSPSVSERNVASIVSMLVSNELLKAKNMFIHDKNKVHPETANS